MSHRVGLIFSLLVAGVGLAVTSLIVLAIDPTSADVLTKAAFFVAIFLTLAGLLVPVLFWGRIAMANREIVFAQFPIAVRQAVLVAVLLTMLLLLQSFRALAWWDGVLVIAGVGFVELALRSRT